MTNPHAIPRPSRTHTGIGSAAVPLPKSRDAHRELRELLETHLFAMQALLEEQQRTIERGLRAFEAARTELLGDLRALSSARAPWVQAVTETRALLYVALRELIVGDDDAGVSMRLPPRVEADDRAR